MRLEDALQPTAAARHPLMGVRVERWQFPGQQPKYTLRDLSGRGRFRAIEELPHDGWECCHACPHGKLDHFRREGLRLILSDGEVIEVEDEAGIWREAWRLEGLGYCWDNRPPTNIPVQWGGDRR